VSDAPFRLAHVSEVVTPAKADAGDSNWHAVRIHFGIASFGIGAYTAEAAGDGFTSEHDETDTGHEELFYVGSGRARLTVDGESVDVPAGTFVYIRDPAVRRGATALEPGTTLLAIGGEPGKVFEVSEWEREYVGGG
jgi:mannose-6-phosphate isomerase-like protein (cupin superfamily)